MTRKRMRVNRLLKKGPGSPKHQHNPLQELDQNNNSLTRLRSKTLKTSVLAASNTTNIIKEQTISRPNSACRNIPCPTCHKVFDGPSLQRHLKVHVRVKPSGFSECPVCKKKFADESNMRRHRRNTHADIWPSKSLKDGKAAECPDCNKQFTERSNMLRHRRRLHGVKKLVVSFNDDVKQFESPVSKKLFSGGRSVRKYPGKVQSSKNIVNVKGVKQFECPECKKIFSERSNMVRHCRQVHDGLKPFECFKCGQRFSEKCNMLRHVARQANCNMDGEIRSILKSSIKENLAPIAADSGSTALVQGAKQIFKCEECFEYFPCLDSLRHHLITVEGQEENSFMLRPGKLFKCPRCFKNFAHERNLLIHLRFHWGEQPFKCSHCSQTFNLKDNLISHEKVHQGETLSESLPKMKPKNNKVVTSTKNSQVELKQIKHVSKSGKQNVGDVPRRRGRPPGAGNKNKLISLTPVVSVADDSLPPKRKRGRPFGSRNKHPKTLKTSLPGKPKIKKQKVLLAQAEDLTPCSSMIQNSISTNSPRKKPVKKDFQCVYCGKYFDCAVSVLRHCQVFHTPRRRTISFSNQKPEHDSTTSKGGPAQKYNNGRPKRSILNKKYWNVYMGKSHEESSFPSAAEVSDRNIEKDEANSSQEGSSADLYREKEKSTSPKRLCRVVFPVQPKISVKKQPPKSVPIAKKFRMCNMSPVVRIGRISVSRGRISFASNSTSSRSNKSSPRKNRDNKKNADASGPNSKTSSPSASLRSRKSEETKHAEAKQDINTRVQCQMCRCSLSGLKYLALHYSNKHSLPVVRLDKYQPPVPYVKRLRNIQFSRLRRSPRKIIEK